MLNNNLNPTTTFVTDIYIMSLGRFKSIRLRLAYNIHA